MAERLHGPYRHGARWRVIGVAADGARVRESFETAAAAQAFIDAGRIALGTRTAGQAVTAYLAHLGQKGRRPGTIVTARYRLVAFLRLAERDPDLAALDVSAARTLYEQRAGETKPDTHHGELALASAWAAWCVRQGWMTSDPFAAVERLGAKSRGKPQLRVDEGRKFLAACLADESPAGVACALALLTGARASEVTERVCRDLDDDGRLLWIDQAKTRAGVRQLPIPELLRPRLVALAKGRQPAERLFGDVTRHWLGHHVGRFCDLAGVPRVSPHGLRGMYATLRVQSGAAVEAIARELGQAGPAVTRAHYIAPGAEEAQIIDLVAARLARTAGK
jgi:integrase